MSGAKAVHYTVEQRAEIEEANSLARERSRLAVAASELERLRVEVEQFRSQYGESLEIPTPPSVSNRSTSVELRKENDHFEQQLSDVRRAITQARDYKRQERLAARLKEVFGDPADPAPLPVRRATEAIQTENTTSPAAVIPPKSTARTVESAASRAERYLGQLDPGIELSDSFLELVDALRGDDDRGGEQDGSNAQDAADALQAEIGRLNREDREHRRVRLAIDELRVRVGALAHAPAGLELSIAAAERAHEKRLVVDLVPLAKAVDTAEKEERQSHDARYVLDVLGDILSEQGYEQMGGFDTVVAENGMLVRKTHWDEHGVLVQINDDEVNLLVVRTAPDPDTAGARVHDVTAESEFCDDLPTVLEQFEDHGVKAQLRRRIPPDVVQVRMIEDESRVVKTERKRMRRAKPKEKRL